MNRFAVFGKASKRRFWPRWKEDMGAVSFYAVVADAQELYVLEFPTPTKPTKHRLRREGNRRGKHAERLAMAEQRVDQPQAATANGAHPQAATLAYTGSKYNTQELSAAAAELLSNLEADGTYKHCDGGKGLHAGGPAETTDDAG